MSYGSLPVTVLCQSSHLRIAFGCAEMPAGHTLSFDSSSPRNRFLGVYTWDWTQNDGLGYGLAADCAQFVVTFLLYKSCRLSHARSRNTLALIVAQQPDTVAVLCQSSHLRVAFSFAEMLAGHTLPFVATRFDCRTVPSRSPYFAKAPNSSSFCTACKCPQGIRSPSLLLK